MKELPKKIQEHNFNHIDDLTTFLAEKINEILDYLGSQKDVRYTVQS